MYVKVRPTAQYKAPFQLLSHLCSVLARRQHRLSFARFGSDASLLDGKGNGLRASLLHVDTEPDYQCCGCAESESEVSTTRATTYRKGNPIQLFPVLLMIAATTFGPISEEARLVIPKRPKNTCGQRIPRKHLLPSYPGGHKSDIMVCEYA